MNLKTILKNVCIVVVFLSSMIKTNQFLGNKLSNCSANPVNEKPRNRPKDPPAVPMKVAKSKVKISLWTSVSIVLNEISIIISLSFHSLIRRILTQSCSARAKNFTKCVFYHVQFSGVIQNIAYHRAIFTLFVYVDYYQNNQFY